MKINPNIEKAEFACKVCLERMRRCRSDPFIDCVWRAFDNEYCDELLAVLESEDINEKEENG